MFSCRKEFRFGERRRLRGRVRRRSRRWFRGRRLPRRFRARKGRGAKYTDRSRVPTAIGTTKRIRFHRGRRFGQTDAHPLSRIQIHLLVQFGVVQEQQTTLDHVREIELLLKKQKNDENKDRPIK